jgi:hypothetical protein
MSRCPSTEQLLDRIPARASHPRRLARSRTSRYGSGVTNSSWTENLRSNGGFGLLIPPWAGVGCE